MADTNVPACLDGLDRTVSKLTALSFVTAKSCKTGWSEYNNHCYKLVKDLVTWPAANIRCKQHGANLASITNNKENNFVADLITNGLLKLDHQKAKRTMERQTM
ncbi:MRC2 [Branchiostoma lanceolatum]|uniref:MRC2 protein n=1 Tax=Branchiostoma lanceolatum TaxID=7740 RepID=A0A8J9VH98_BRALA|nr:MRC2 [Branchiostoma lanceolatum]